MTENEAKAIKWLKNVRDDAVVTLDHIQKNEPNVSPMLYAGRKQKAETIIEMCEELEQHRAIGTIEEFKALKEKSVAKKPIRKPNLDWTNEEVTCPGCDRNVSEFRNKYCDCGQKLDWGEEE